MIFLASITKKSTQYRFGNREITEGSLKVRQYSFEGQYSFEERGCRVVTMTPTVPVDTSQFLPICFQANESDGDCKPGAILRKQGNLMYLAFDDLLASSADKQSNALAHFNFFLKSYCVQIGIIIVEASSLGNLLTKLYLSSGIR